MLAVDLSGSMKLPIWKLTASRSTGCRWSNMCLATLLRVAKATSGVYLIWRHRLFTGTAYDRQTIAQMLNESVLGLVGERTAIGDAIAGG